MNKLTFICPNMVIKKDGNIYVVDEVHSHSVTMQNLITKEKRPESIDAIRSTYNLVGYNYKEKTDHLLIKCTYVKLSFRHLFTAGKSYLVLNVAGKSANGKGVFYVIQADSGKKIPVKAGEDCFGFFELRN